MTNKEYIEKNNISFSDAMKMWDNKTNCINDWLNQERIEHHKFKVGDFVILKGVNDGIGIVVDVADCVYYKVLNRDGKFSNDRNCNIRGLYHKYDPDVFHMLDESNFKKIF